MNVNEMNIFFSLSFHFKQFPIVSEEAIVSTNMLVSGYKKRIELLTLFDASPEFVYSSCIYSSLFP